ncbi:MAG: 3-hydroxyisobutyryl-CoA hydrolase [Gammaproteobacteria bacterium RIFCSPHIGHO2_12_FULL_41_15]|nr:MAG: 3-hydroxyisobutyryl-CoA hydrolase [Gammaproteobacteria bacterium RIFCSPHIGHO2_12_FULL_41_15]
MTQDILFSELAAQQGAIGQIVLNRPQALNALSTSMCQTIREQLQQWQTDAHVKAVLIRGKGERAFCAGGDIRVLYQQGRENIAAAKTFFQQEYQMNAALFHFNKPYIALLDGITMGGGAGISIHGSHRVATERLVFAMPEVGIGFFPDIGAGHFLTRCPHRMGYYLGLTGDRISASDAKALGLVTHIISSQQQEDLIKTLLTTPFDAHDFEFISGLIDSFSVAMEAPKLAPYTALIEKCFSVASVEEAIARLTADASTWSLSIVKTLQTRSPTSLKVTWEQLKRAAHQTFDATMQMELNIAYQFLNTHDFFEGVRAAVIDKDQTPHWQPSQLAAVTPTIIDAFFTTKELPKRGD